MNRTVRYIAFALSVAMMLATTAGCITDPKQLTYSVACQNWSADNDLIGLRSRDKKEDTGMHRFDAISPQNVPGKWEFELHNRDYELLIMYNNDDATILCDAWIHINGKRQDASGGGTTADAMIQWWPSGLNVQSARGRVAQDGLQSIKLERGTLTFPKNVTVTLINR